MSSSTSEDERYITVEAETLQKFMKVLINSQKRNKKRKSGDNHDIARRRINFNAVDEGWSGAGGGVGGGGGAASASGGHHHQHQLPVGANSGKFVNRGSTGGSARLRRSAFGGHSVNLPNTWSGHGHGHTLGSGGQHYGRQLQHLQQQQQVLPLYKSPQFFCEFPALDGTVGSGAGGSAARAGKRHYQSQSHHANQHSQHHQHQPQHQYHQDYHHGLGRQYGHHSHRDYRDGSQDVGGVGLRDGEMDELGLRPLKYTASWLQQQVKADKEEAAAAADQGLNLQGPGHHQMAGKGGGGAGGGGGSRSGAPLPGSSTTAPSMLVGIADSRSTSPAVVGSGGFPQCGLDMGSSPTPPHSLHQQQQQANWGGGAKCKDKDYVEKPEVAHMQRPIIREEDLERHDSWTEQDVINNILTFSDDEYTPEEHQGQGIKQHASSASSVLAGSDQRKLSGSNAAAASWQRDEEAASSLLLMAKTAPRGKLKKNNSGNKRSRPRSAAAGEGRGGRSYGGSGGSAAGAVGSGSGGGDGGGEGGGSASDTSTEFKCPECSITYIYKKPFRKHLKSHDLQITDLDIYNKGEKRRYRYRHCSICKVYIKDRRKYKEHTCFQNSRDLTDFNFSINDVNNKTEFL